MSNPFTATWRIMTPYTIDGGAHKLHEFVMPAVVGGTSYQIPVRGGGSNINWEDAADKYAAYISFLLATATTPGTAELQQLVSGSWLTKSSHAVLFPNSGGTYIKATQVTWIFKDTANNMMRTLILEGVAQVPQRYVGVNAIPAGLFHDCSDGFDGIAATGTEPWFWMVSGQELFLRSAPIVSVVASLNRKLRRKRGLA